MEASECHSEDDYQIVTIIIIVFVPATRRLQDAIPSTARPERTPSTVAVER